MAILYVTDQGATLTKRGHRLVVEKQGRTLHWVHAFKVNQVILMGHVSLTPGAIAFLLEQGIDTVFLSYYGKYRGRLIAHLGKNIELRRRQFARIGDPAFRLAQARTVVQGKLYNCRVLLRRQNREIQSEPVAAAIHRLRRLEAQAGEAHSLEVLMGLEGNASATYFGCFPHLLRAPGMSFPGRSRRPPQDPVNVLLSLGYTLLANALHTQIMVAGLDPYLGCLHAPDYGRPSLVLDLMEEFRPVLVDALVLYLVNRRIITPLDFFRPEEREPAAFDFADPPPAREDYPILLGHQGLKKFVTYFERRLHHQVFYLPRGERLTYRDVLLAQVRAFIRTLEEDAPYQPFQMR
jgi:CRISPR-associated protein Cas1